MPGLPTFYDRLLLAGTSRRPARTLGVIRRSAPKERLTAILAVETGPAKKCFERLLHRLPRLPDRAVYRKIAEECISVAALQKCGDGSHRLMRHRQELRRAWITERQGGQVTMPLAPAFWSRTFGMLTDRFGVSWAVNGEPVAFK